MGQLVQGPEPLEGGITNRNYRASFGETEYVIRVPGKDTNLLEIDRRCEVAANDRAARSGVAPPVAVALDDPAAIVTEFVTGQGMSSDELREPSMLSRVAVSLARIHDGADAPSPCNVFDSFRLVETYAKTAADRGATIPDAYEEAHATAARIEEALSGPEHDPVPCHNDLLAANFIRGEADQVWIVDWEYAGMGDRYFDLANFAVNNELDPSDERALLRAYFDETPTAGAARRAVADEVHVRLPRGDVGRRPERRLRARLRLHRVRLEALRAHGDDRRRRELRALARGGAWRLSVSCPTPPAA